METKVVLKTKEDLCWQFESEYPSFNLGEHGGYSIAQNVDPFPAYAHDKGYVNVNLLAATNAFPIKWPLTLYILPNEFVSRTNAYTQAGNYDYSKKLENILDGQDQYERCPFIVLSGKRIPIMPAMTRYLVAHEYGHVIEDWIAYKRGIKDYELLEEYRKLRGLEKSPLSYGGGWHKTVGEVFANDFRMILVRKELEFWPHDCCPPMFNDDVVNWWWDAKEKYAEVEEVEKEENAVS